MATSSVFHLPFHLLCLIINVYHWYYLAPFPNAHSYLPYTQLLTMWGMFAHTLYFFLCTVGDVVDLLMLGYMYMARNQAKKAQGGTSTGTSTRPAQVGRYRAGLHAFFRGLSFPLALIVGMLFWGVYWVDRELIYPKAFELHSPPLMNHIQHSVPAIAALLDMLLTDHHYEPQTMLLDLGLVGGVSVLYVVVLLYVRMTQQVWLYPFIGLMGPSIQAVFFTLSVGMTVVCYFGGCFASKWLWKAKQKYAATHKTIKKD